MTQVMKQLSFGGLNSAADHIWAKPGQNNIPAESMKCRDDDEISTIETEHGEDLSSRQQFQIQSQFLAQLNGKSDIQVDLLSGSDRKGGDSADDVRFNSAAKKKANIDKSKYKTEMCRNFVQNGYCQYGKKCNYAHGLEELMEKHNTNQFYKTRNCILFYEKGWCNYGSRCHFIHEYRSVDQIKSEYHHQNSDCLENGIVLSSVRLPIFQQLCNRAPQSNFPSRCQPVCVKPQMNEALKAQPCHTQNPAPGKKYKNLFCDLLKYQPSLF